jgi:sortase A
MSKMKSKTLLFFLVLLIGITSGIFYVRKDKSEVLGIETSNSDMGSLYRPSPTVSPIAEMGKPKKINIPSLGVEADIEEVGTDAEGKMDVPREDMNAGWWKFGTIPGVKGNSVIAGHFDRKDGGPAIFYDLKSLKTGDEFSVTDENGRNIPFIVYKAESFKVSEFPINEVFGNTDSANLNLITCSGTWDNNNANYSDRFVVFARRK